MRDELAALNHRAVPFLSAPPPTRAVTIISMVVFSLNRFVNIRSSSRRVRAGSRAISHDVSETV